MAPDFRIAMTAPERDLMLRTFKFSPALESRLRFALLGPEYLEVGLSQAQLVELCDVLDLGIPKMRNDKDRDALAHFYLGILKFLQQERLAGILGPDDDEKDDEDTGKAEARTGPFGNSTLLEKLQADVRSGKYKTKAAAQAALDRLNQEYNDTPLPERCGLTPAQCYVLMRAPWDHPHHPIRLHRDIPTALLAGSEWLHAALGILALAEERGGFPLTKSGRMNRASVRAVLEKGLFSDLSVKLNLDYMKVIDEDHIYALHGLRGLMQSAGLLRNYKGKIVVTQAGKKALKAGPVPELLVSLFEAFIANFNLAYLDQFDEFHGFLGTRWYILYVVHKLSEEGVSLEELVDRALIPEVRAEFPKYQYHDMAETVMDSRMLRPLRGLGLLTMEDTGKTTMVRATPLFRKLLSFEFNPEP